MKTQTKKRIREPLIWDRVYNNPRANRQQDHDMKKEKEDRIKSTLYDAREDYRSFEREIRTNYYKGTRMTFREFLHKCESILDKLD